MLRKEGHICIQAITSAKKAVVSYHFFYKYPPLYYSGTEGQHMNEKRQFEMKIGKTTYVVEVKNAEKSRSSADDLIRKIISDEIDGRKNFARSS